MVTKPTRLYFLSVFISTFFLGNQTVQASVYPGGPVTVGNFTTLEDFVTNNITNLTTSFGSVEQVDNGIDFSGIYRYTGLAYESGHQNVVSTVADQGPSSVDLTKAGVVINKLTSDATRGTPSYGTFRSINFDQDNLYFSDSDGPYNINLDPTFAWRGPTGTLDNTGNYFQVWRLLDPVTLTYLHVDTFLPTGTLIVGFNDNGISCFTDDDGNIIDAGCEESLNSGADADYDDLIIALVPTPIPAAIWFMCSGLLGLLGFASKNKAQVIDIA